MTVKVVSTGSRIDASSNKALRYEIHWLCPLRRHKKDYAYYTQGMRRKVHTIYSSSESIGDTLIKTIAQICFYLKVSA